MESGRKASRKVRQVRQVRQRMAGMPCPFQKRTILKPETCGATESRTSQSQTQGAGKHPCAGAPFRGCGILPRRKPPVRFRFVSVWEVRFPNRAPATGEWMERGRNVSRKVRQVRQVRQWRGCLAHSRNGPFSSRKPAARLKVAPPKAKPKGRENSHARGRPSGGAASFRAASPRSASGPFFPGRCDFQIAPRVRRVNGEREECQH